MKALSVVLIATSLFIINSCNSTSADKTATEQKQSDPANIVKQSFYMQYKTGANEIEAGKVVTLYFTPRIKGRESEPVALESGHGKKVNLMIVSDDLSQFYQLWPEYQADGSYTADFTFPTGGKYEHILVYKPSSNNGEKVTENIPLTVKGKDYIAARFNETKLTDETEDGYSVTLNVKEGDWKVNSKMRIEGMGKKNGSEVNASAFDTYQDGKANMVILKMDNKEYDHSHSDAVNGRFDFQHTFKQPGRYRAFLQFKVGGKIYTTDFTFNVKY